MICAGDSLALFLFGCGLLSIQRKHIWSITMLKDELSVGVLGALELYRHQFTLPIYVLEDIPQRLFQTIDLIADTDETFGQLALQAPDNLFGLLAHQLQIASELGSWRHLLHDQLAQVTSLPAAELYLALEVGDIGISAELLDLGRRSLSFLRLELLLNCCLIASLF